MYGLASNMISLIFIVRYALGVVIIRHFRILLVRGCRSEINENLFVRFLSFYIVNKYINI